MLNKKKNTSLKIILTGEHQDSKKKQYYTNMEARTCVTHHSDAKSKQKSKTSGSVFGQDLSDIPCHIINS